MELKIHASREIFSNEIALYMAQRDEARHLYVAQTIEFKLQEPGYHSSPMIRLQTSEAQLLMDELWQAGLRPSEGTGSAGALAAAEKHLADMRTIAFGQLKLGLP